MPLLKGFHIITIYPHLEGKYKMASRFFATGSSDSESESSEDELVPQSKPTSQAVKMFFSDSEEDTKRVVRSAKSKRFV